MSDHDSPSRNHSRGSHNSDGSKKSSSSSASEPARPPEDNPDWNSNPRGRTSHRREPPKRNRSTSDGSSSHPGPENWPFSVRDIGNLDTVINKHLDDLAQIVAAVEMTEDTIDHYEDAMEDMEWQMFLFRTGACRPRAGSEEEPWACSLGAITADWRHAANMKHRASKYLEQQETRAASGVSILLKLLSERNRRNRVAGGKRREEPAIVVA